jgi:hypothetical protein
MERDMRELCVRLDAMEMTQRRALDAGDVNEVEIEEDVAKDAVEERLLKTVLKLGAREKIDIPMYEGNLYTE